MSLNAFEYKHLGEINRGIRTLTRSVQAQGNAATVPVETYNQLFARYEELRAQLDAALATSAHWERESEKLETNRDHWVAYAQQFVARALAAESELRRLKADAEKQD
ncbi:hypothetical protein [Asaia bogorensis]|uniref:hypothetical protein n=1 Tax=Asaia bogorensis TaxID=91915 RepID=UPI00301A9854